MNKSVIYIIKNKVNGKFYIGSTKNSKKREQQHFRNLEKNKHDNIYLQNAYNKYGKKNFIFEIKEYCDIKDQFKIEQKWIDSYIKTGLLYNINPIASEPPHTPESIEKMRKNKLNTKPWNKGKIGVYKKETIEKISNSLKGRYVGGKNPWSRSVVRITDGKIYSSLAECVKDNNVSRSTLHNHLVNKVFTVPQMYMYYENYQKLNEEEKYNLRYEALESKRSAQNAKRVIRLCDGKIYSSIAECARNNNLSNKCIADHCNNMVKNAKFSFC